MGGQERRVLVTGGAGFIGSHVCERYRDAGWRVTALDDLSAGHRRNVPEGVELVVEDIRSDAASALVRGGGFEVVSHHAAQIDVRVSVQRPRHDASINIDGLLNLLEASRDGGVRRFVLVSSGGVVYGEPAGLPVAEEAPKAPLSGYGVSKLAGEHYLYAFRHLHGLEGVALRYSNVYGPRQDPHGEAGVVALFSRRIVKGTPLTVFGDGEQTRDYVYVGDVADANLLVTDLAVPEPASIDAPAFNVATGLETSVNRLAEILLAVAGSSLEVRSAPARPGEIQRSCLDARKLRGLGWEPRVPLDEGLRRTFDHISQQS